MGAEREEIAEPEERASTRIDREHMRIRAFLGQLREAAAPSRIAELLDALAPLLAGHFEEEERPHGLFDELLALRPSNENGLGRLRREHRELVDEIEALRKNLERVQGELLQIAQDKTMFERKLQAHDLAETRMVLDTHLQDDGGSG